MPAALLLGVDVPAQPERVAFLFGMSLLGVWGTLIPDKLFEGRRLDPSARRLVNLAAGALVGLTGVALASWVELGSAPGLGLLGRRGRADVGVRGRPWAALISYVAYFGVLALLVGWPWMAARDRKARFRVFPVVKAGAVAGCSGWSCRSRSPGAWGSPP